MQILDMLQTRRAEVVSEIEKLTAELAKIDKMLAAAGVVTSQSAVVSQAPATKDDAILQAIAAGNRTPAKIGEFMREKLGLEVNDASTRTRLSRMKAAEKIDLDSAGWKIKQND